MTDDIHDHAKIIAGDAAVVARRYARALLDLAAERGMVDAVAADMQGLRKLARESAELRHILQHPGLSRAQSGAAMAKVTAAAKLNALSGSFLALLAQNRRLANLPSIIDAFLVEVATSRGELVAHVRAAQALTPAQREAITRQLSQQASGKVRLVVEEDKSLLGGLTVQVGSRLIDASLKGKLERLERQLKEHAAHMAA